MISDLNVAALCSFGVSPAQVNITSVLSARRLLGTSSSGSGAAPRALSGGGAVLVAFTIEGSASVMEAVAVSLAALLEAPAFAAAYAVRTGGTQLTVTSVQAVLVLGGPAVTPTPVPTVAPTSASRGMAIGFSIAAFVLVAAAQHP